MKKLENVLKQLHINGIGKHKELKGLDRNKWFSYICILIVFSSMLVGCSRADKNGSMKSEDGRSYGGRMESVVGDEVSTNFFEYTVTGWQKQSTFPYGDGIYSSKEGMTYLTVTLTLTNDYVKDIDLSINDFALLLTDDEQATPIYGYGNKEINNSDYFDETFVLKQGETITKSIMFCVKDQTEYAISYKELYSDGFEGDSYITRLLP